MLALFNISYGAVGVNDDYHAPIQYEYAVWLNSEL